MKFHVKYGIAAIVYNMILGIGVSVRFDTPSFTACDVRQDINVLSGYRSREIGITDLMDELIKLRSDMITVNSSTKTIRKVEKIRDHVTSLMYAISNFKRKQPNLVRFITYPYEIRYSQYAKRAESALRTYLKSSSQLYTRTMSQLSLASFKTKYGLNVDRTKAINVKASLKDTKLRLTSTTKQRMMLKQVTKTFDILNKDVTAISKYTKLITKDFAKLAEEPLYPNLRCTPPANNECNCRTRGTCISIPSLFAFCDCNVKYFGTNCGETYLLASDWLTCRAYGEVHYITYDGAAFNFQGECLYLLSKFEFDDGRKRTVIWEVFQRNWIKNGPGDQVAWPKAMYLRFHQDVVFGIHQNINGKPHITRDGQNIDYGDQIVTQANVNFTVRINPDGKYTTIGARGVEIKFDGNWDSSVSISPDVPGKNSKIQGMCGNANGDPDDDYTTERGTDVKSKPNRGGYIGNSFQVKDNTIESSSEACVPNRIPDEPWKSIEALSTILKMASGSPCFYPARSTCEGFVPRFELVACIVDSYYVASLQEKCDILKKQVYFKYGCPNEIFDCHAIMLDTQVRIYKQCLRR